ncbi:hypothetical protein V8B97DRAFT_909040 [Scleroderma yunnanense]
MGTLTSLTALWVWVMWVTQGAVPQILTPLMMTSQTYVNSILAVLNARSPVEHSHSSRKPQTSFELPTFSMPEYISLHPCQSSGRLRKVWKM